MQQRGFPGRAVEAQGGEALSSFPRRQHGPAAGEGRHPVPASPALQEPWRQPAGAGEVVGRTQNRRPEASVRLLSVNGQQVVEAWLWGQMSGLAGVPWGLPLQGVLPGGIRLTTRPPEHQDPWKGKATIFSLCRGQEEGLGLALGWWTKLGSARDCPRPWPI